MCVSVVVGKEHFLSYFLDLECLVALERTISSELVGKTDIPAVINQESIMFFLHGRPPIRISESTTIHLWDFSDRVLAW